MVFVFHPVASKPLGAGIFEASVIGRVDGCLVVAMNQDSAFDHTGSVLERVSVQVFQSNSAIADVVDQQDVTPFHLRRFDHETEVITLGIIFGRIAHRPAE